MEQLKMVASRMTDVWRIPFLVFLGMKCVKASYIETTQIVVCRIIP